MRRSLVVILVWLAAWAPAAGETPAPEGIEVVDVALVAWIASRQHARAGTLSSLRADPARRGAFRAFVDALAMGDWAGTRRLAQTLDYRVVAIREAGAWYVVASDGSGTGRDPIVALSLAPRRDLVLQAPHVPFERGTAKQAAILLRELGARAALIAGAHRCASKTFSSCDGRTRVCGAREAYRDSDPAHNTASLFHLAHVAFAARWPGAVTVSLHGMRRDRDGVRTSLILSNGIRAEDTSAATPATRLRLLMAAALPKPGAVVSCNLAADDAHRYRKLCGTTNVQGRHANGDADPCRKSVESGTGRFIHVEQDWRVLGPYAQAWERIGEDALARAFMAALGSVVGERVGR